MFIYEEVKDVFIENTIIEKVFNGDTLCAFRITPNDGYAINDGRVDEFTASDITVPADYDFTSITLGTFTYSDENEVETNMSVLMTGLYKIFALPIDIAPWFIRSTLFEERLSEAYLKRTDFSYAFANTAYTELPLSKITATSIIYMFMNCQELTTGENLTVTINSDNPSALYVCSNCTKMAVAPKFIFNNAKGESPVTVCKIWTSAFLNCASMTTCDIYLGDGSQNPITTRNIMQNTFKNCDNLEHLTFTGRGAPMYLDLSDCTKLSVSSMQSLKGALLDVSNATSGNYNITLADVSYDLFTEEEKAEISALGWTINIVNSEVTT